MLSMDAVCVKISILTFRTFLDLLFGVFRLRSQMNLHKVIRRHRKKLQMQDARILRNETYISYVALTKDEAQRRRRTFCEAVKPENGGKG